MVAGWQAHHLAWLESHPERDQRWLRERLDDGFHVHHIDGNRLNNAAENLHVFNSPSDHGAAHRSLELIAFELLQRGLVVFDRERGRYQFADQSI